ncbi:hypothetical protein CQZ93_04195 [Ochrobactrum vermis]|nr:hypothetical protein CQZ93_04195 [Ochrobactrum vermis]
MPSRSVLPSPAQAHLELAGLQDAVKFQKAACQHSNARQMRGQQQTDKLQSRKIRRALPHPPDDQSGE